MKKIHYFAAMLCAAMLLACDGSKSGGSFLTKKVDYKQIWKNLTAKRLPEYDPLPIEKMNDRAAYIFAGPVKKVMQDDYFTYMFDRNGNLTEDKRQGKETVVRRYESPTRYRQGRNAYYNIEYGEAKRSDVLDSDNDESLGYAYEFDNYGRLKSFVQRDYDTGLKVEHVYNGKKRFFPNQSIYTEDTETGSRVIVENFSDVEIDEYGNWTKCTVTIEIVTTTYDEEDGDKTEKQEPFDVEVSRIITYYDEQESADE